MSNQRLARIALLVNDYEEAIDFYTRKLGFTLVEDTPLSDTKRWVVVSPSGGGCSFILAKATTEEQRKAVGHQTGGRVFLFLHTDNLEEDHERLRTMNIRIVRGPSREAYGKVLVFEDLYGNLWDLIEPANIYYRESLLSD